MSRRGEGGRPVLKVRTRVEEKRELRLDDKAVLGAMRAYLGIDLPSNAEVFVEVPSQAYGELELEARCPLVVRWLVVRDEEKEVQVALAADGGES